MGLKRISTLDVELIIINGQKIHTRHHITPHVKKLHFRVAARIGDQEHRTNSIAVSKTSYPVWDSKHNYNVAKDNSLTLELFCEHEHRKTHRVGFSEEINLLSLQPFHDHNIKIRNKKGIECGIIVVRFEIPMSSPMNPAQQSQSRTRLHKLAMINNVINTSQVQQIPPMWADLLISLNTVAQLVKVMGQLDPMARLALTTVSFAIEMAAQQTERDKRVEGLIDTMATIYRLILDAEPLETIKSFEETLARLLETTKECALFVADYCQGQNFAMKVIRGTMPHLDMIINSFEQSFISLRMEFVTNACLHGVLYTIRILEKVEDISKDVHDINATINLPVYGKGWDAQGVCFPGSLKGVLGDVTRWVVCQQPAAPVYLLEGPPGCGKTCVANSIAAMFQVGRRLGACIFLDKGHQDPSNIFASIARELAAFDDKLKICISKAISRQPRLPKADPEQQLQGLIIEPLSTVTVIGPILVVIDGLDSCEDRSRILSALEHAKNIPGNLRILITARPEADFKAHLAGIPHCHIRQMPADGEGIVNDVPNYASQCLGLLQDARPTIFADISLEEVLTDFKVKSCGGFLWLSAAIRFLTIASDDTARAFLTEISSAAVPPNHTTAMLALKHATHQALSATSPVKLKSDLSIGAAAALGVVGLGSDKSVNVLEQMVARGLMKYDDIASQYLATIHHPASKYARGTKNVHICSHANTQNDHSANICMAHVCLEFLDIRLAADVCVRSCRTRKNRELIIDPNLVETVPEQFRPYINEAYRYVSKFWIAHLEDVRSCCAIDSLRSKLLRFPRHLLHLLELEHGQKEDLDDILQKLLTVIECSELNSPNLQSQFHKLLTGVRDSHHGHGKRDHGSEYWEAPVETELYKDICVCPLYPAWRVSSRTACSFKADVEYKGRATADSSMSLMITPPVMPLADEDGRICRTIKEVQLVVDRTVYDDAYQQLPPDAQIGVVITRDSIPSWARQLPSPFHEEDVVTDRMKHPWLRPVAGEISSTIIRWVDDKFRFDMDHHLQCPLQPRDRLGIIVRFNSPCGEVSFRIPVMLKVEYALNDGDGD